MNEKIRLYGFNNLTKTLSFNIFDIRYTETEEEKRKYIEYINKQYSTNKLTEILQKATSIIGANVLYITKQDYEPSGASVNILISEDNLEEVELNFKDCNIKKDTVLGHLDKSHLTIHTYPETHPKSNISTFRVDIDVSTCGTISPLKTLNYLIGDFLPDIITIDYRVRGFTRDIEGNKFFIDHSINSIQDYIDCSILTKYKSINKDIVNSNIFHTKMIKKDFKIKNYITNQNLKTIHEEEVIKKLNRERKDIFNNL